MSRVNPVKFGKVERLDSHHKAILRFIKNSSNCTENQVVKSMEEQKVCSKMTTLRKLDELIEKQEIRDLLKQGQSGFHRFVINENNEFNRIDKILTEIETAIDTMDEPVKKIERLLAKQRRTVLDEWEEIRKLKGLEREARKEQIKKLVSNDLTSLEHHCKFNYVQIIETMLHILTVQINDNIHSDNDLQILYTKLIKLIRKVSQHSPDFHTMKTINLLEHHIKEMASNERVKVYAEENEINLKATDNLITVVKNFRKEFLSETEQRELENIEYGSPQFLT